MTMTSSIELVNIHEELVRLWDEQQGKDHVLARLFNFVIITEKSERTPYYQELINKVIAKFPCRITLIVEEPTPSAPYLRTSVSGKSIGEGDGKIFCEQILIEGGGELRNRIPYIVLPHIVPDLPLYVLWTRHLLEDSPLFSMLERFADRIIFDSEAARDLNHFSNTLLNFINQFHCDMGDLNWAALSGWRRLLASVFNEEKSLETLNKAHHVRITYNKNPSKYFQHNEVKAAYLQAWLASEMGWNYKNFEESEGNVRIRYTHPPGDVTVLLTSKKEEKLPAGTLLAIEIESSNHSGHYLFKRELNSRQIFVQFSDDHQCDLPYCSYLAGFSPGEEVVEEIFYGMKSEKYKDMLHTLSQIPWKGEK